MELTGVGFQFYGDVFPDLLRFLQSMRCGSSGHETQDNDTEIAQKLLRFYLLITFTNNLLVLLGSLPS